MDINMEIGGLLSDMAAIQSSVHSRFGYKRAAKTIYRLEQPLTKIVSGAKFPKIPNIGPSSERIMREYLDTGSSPTVANAIARSGQQDRIARLHRFRKGFLSYAGVEAAIRTRRPNAVNVSQYRGDFQMHSEWSDGSESIEAIVQDCLELGHACACLTDHSYGLPIARGVSMQDLRKQHVEIDRVNAKYRGRFRMFKGIEANILADGHLDMSAEELRMMELVVASPHSLLRRDSDQTMRMMGAVSQRGVNILGHPLGRMYDSRPGVAADWSRVFTVAAKRQVAIEIDGSWHRQDIPFELARAALAAGCIFAVDSDGHSASERRHYSRVAIAHARLAGIPPERVINCWSDEMILDWAKRAWNN
jgi:histidinol phosphatase-like PHP family hydrolase